MTFPLMSFYLITIEILRDYALYSKKIPGGFSGVCYFLRETCQAFVLYTDGHLRP